jgi:prepilin-type N-terminal cleavage/methylation domain-containing protein
MRSMQRADGFTLIEALVAVTLLALLFGALMPVFQQGLAVLRSGDRHTRAVLLAQSILDRELALGGAQGGLSAQDGASQGSLSHEAGQDYRWQVTRTPFIDEQVDPPSDETGSQSASGANLDEGLFELVQVSVVVRWPENEFGVQLHTLALQSTQ